MRIVAKSEMLTNLIDKCKTTNTTTIYLFFFGFLAVFGGGRGLSVLRLRLAFSVCHRGCFLFFLTLVFLLFFFLFCGCVFFVFRCAAV